MKIYNISRARRCGFVAVNLFRNVYIMSNYNRATSGYKHYLFSFVKGYEEDTK